MSRLHRAGSRPRHCWMRPRSRRPSVRSSRAGCRMWPPKHEGHPRRRTNCSAPSATAPPPPAPTRRGSGEGWSARGGEEGAWVGMLGQGRGVRQFHCLTPTSNFARRLVLGRCFPRITRLTRRSRRTAQPVRQVRSAQAVFVPLPQDDDDDQNGDTQDGDQASGFHVVLFNAAFSESSVASRVGDRLRRVAPTLRQRGIDQRP